MGKRFIAYVLFLGALLLLVIPAVHAEDALEWYIKGQNSATVGNYEDAIEYYDNALSVDNKYASAYAGKAIALNHLDRYNEAVVAADAALALKKNPDALNARAYALFALGRYEESVQTYDLFFTYQINIPDAYYTQGKSYIQLNETEKAISAFDRCTYFDPNSLDCWNQKGLALISRGRYEDALIAFNQCTRITAADAEIWNNKGLAYAGLEDYPMALDAFKMAINLDPSYTEAQVNLDKAYLRKPFFTMAVTPSPAIPVATTVIQQTAVATLSPTGTETTLPSDSVGFDQPHGESQTPVQTTYAPLSPLSGILSLIFGMLLVITLKK